MPSPFPGMDPYIEAQRSWQGFHNAWIAYCAEVLNRLLPDDYIAQIEERLSLVTVDDEPVEARPDVLIARESAGRPAPAAPGAGAAVLEPVTIPLARHRLVEEKQTFLQIHKLTDMELTTVLELLSPTNKPGSGRPEYLAKRDALIDQPIHLVEIDLLLRGARVPMREPLPPGHYFAFVARAERRPDCSVYAWTVRDPFPTIPVPLKAPDPDVWLDLGEPFALTYERGRLGRSLRHDRPLPAAWPLHPDDRAWAEALARTAARG